MYDNTLSLDARGLYAMLVCLQGNDDHCYPTIAWMCSKSLHKRTKVYLLLGELSNKGLISRSKNPLQNKTVTFVHNEMKNEH